MKRQPKILLTIFIIVLLIGGGTYAYVSLAGRTAKARHISEEESHPDRLTKAEVETDRNQAIEFIESVHPYFVDGSDLSPYEDAKDKYIAATQQKMSWTDFQIATAEYFCFFQDGHTTVWWDEEDYLDIPHTFQDGHMYAVAEDNDAKRRITAIDNVSTEDILAVIDKEIPAENEMARKINYENYFEAKSILELAGVDMSKEHYTVKLDDGSSYECSYLSEEDKMDFEDSGNYEVDNSWSMDGDVFVVHFVGCVYDDKIKAIAEELEKAVENGCTKVIIDVRDNPGGDSAACSALIEAMGMTVPSYGVFTRYSPEAKNQREGYARYSGASYIKGSTACVKNPDVHLAVLCNRRTFSSATMLCVWVRDGQLGTLVGEPSSNMPNCYGDILYVTLENSQIQANVSHKRFFRPDSNNNERMLIPDIETESDAAYDAAVECLNH